MPHQDFIQLLVTLIFIVRNELIKVFIILQNLIQVELKNDLPAILYMKILTILRNSIQEKFSLI